MTERRRPYRRGRGRPSTKPHADVAGEPNPYRDPEPSSPGNGSDVAVENGGGENRDNTERSSDSPQSGQRNRRNSRRDGRGSSGGGGGGGQRSSNRDSSQQRGRTQQRRGRGRNQGRGREQQERPSQPVTVDTETTGWFDASRDAGYIRRPENSYLPDPGDAYVPPELVRQFSLRRGDRIRASAGADQRGRMVAAEILEMNGVAPDPEAKRLDFSALTAAYPERKLFLETGKPAKGGPELTRRAIDLIAPIGYGQRALIVAPARAGKTMLLNAITEGIAHNHPDAELLILLVDERPEEVTEAQSWGVGEVVASSFDQPAIRHTEVAEMVLERARRLVEMGRDVVIVLDSLTRMGRSYNNTERGTGRTLSGGLDATAMAKPKAFFGSARAVADTAGGGSLTIIATALVETGSRMDDVIFEEFKGTGNCEIKLDRSLAEKRIFPAFDIAASGTRREDKLFRPDQLDAVYTLRRGLQQMPPQGAMEWLIKRIGNTPNNDALLSGL
ncbi:MAG TPA: transcription termination factor Rho [Gemmatimonadales bacterium]|nr:transcription termination factor Rho [Gemmatimonadales bacterium]